MRKIRYSVAMSLDGYIAGPKGESDWITMDPEIDFAALLSRFDTVLMGRKTYQALASMGRAKMPGMKTYVFSGKAVAGAYPGVTIIRHHLKALRALRAEKGKDIWLFGGGSLFQSLLATGFVDTVEVAIIPVLLGAGTRFLAGPTKRAQTNLVLTSHKIYKSGIASLQYATKRGNA